MWQLIKSYQAICVHTRNFMLDCHTRNIMLDSGPDLKCSKYYGRATESWIEGWHAAAYSYIMGLFAQDEPNCGDISNVVLVIDGVDKGDLTLFLNALITRLVMGELSILCSPPIGTEKMESCLWMLYYALCLVILQLHSAENC